MAISLYSHNAEAYAAAAAMLAETGKAAIVHPTGTGKSFIAFKYCEEHPVESVLWLSPSEYIFRTQMENLAATGAEIPENITFLTYAKLMLLDDAELDVLRPDCIILDEFHRCGAEQWGEGVRRLLDAYPDTPILGLSATNVRYLDNQRDMAAELFEGNIASEMTLGEAIARGILNAPTYVLSVFAYQKDYERLKSRVRRVKSKAARDEAERYLDALRRALEHADGLDVIFNKHMVDRAGKYLVFCANVEHMREMMGHVPEWFGKIDAEPHIYSAYSDDPETSRAFAGFKADTGDHLKLLFCIDMLNEGVHVEDVSGVILFRPTVSPIIYKQQIGRALSASKSREPVIFDIVNNIENLYSIGAIQDEMEDAVQFFRDVGRDREIVRERFRVIDEVRDTRRLFSELEASLTPSWDFMYGLARQYFLENGNLLPAQKYMTDEGYQLSAWLVTQRTLHRRGELSRARTMRLERIGMDWRTRNERSWDESFAEAKRYYAKHGDLMPPSRTRLSGWLVLQRKKRREGLLPTEKIAQLEQIGMTWEREDDWEERLAQARDYYSQHGDLDIPVGYVTEDGTALGAWYRSIRNKYREGTLPEERKRQLEEAGILWSSVKLRTWLSYYSAAKRFYQENGHLNVHSKYVDAVTDLRLGTWISTQRYRYGKGKLGQEQIELLEQIGMSWQRFDSKWENGFEAALAYREKTGTPNAPKDYVTDDGFCLGAWVCMQRQRQKDGKLDKDRIERLDKIGFQWSPTRDSWQRAYKAAEKYFQKFGNLDVKIGYVDTESQFKLGTWINNQRTRYRTGHLTKERIRALESIGMIWSKNKSAKRTTEERDSARI